MQRPFRMPCAIRNDRECHPVPTGVGQLPGPALCLSVRIRLMKHLAKTCLPGTGARFLLLVGLLWGMGAVLGGCTYVEPPNPHQQVNWLMEGGTAGRTRHSDFRLTPPLRLGPEIAVPDSGEFVSPVAYADGLLYADTEASLHVLHAGTGEVAWEIQLPGYFLSPLVWRERVFVRAESGDTGYLFALDAGNGTKLWQFQFPAVGSEYQNIGGHVTSPVIANATLLVASARTLYALHPDTGDIQWETTLEEPVASSVAANEHMAYVSDFFHTYAVQMETGQEVWRFRGQEPSLFFAPVLWQDRVFVTNGRWLHALDAASGQELWQAEHDMAPLIPAGAVGDLVLSKTNRALVAFDVQTGERRWRYETLNFVALPSLADTYLYTLIRLGAGSHVVALDLATGQEIWRSPQMSLSRSAPVSAGGQLFVRSTEGAIISLQSVANTVAE